MIGCGAEQAEPVDDLVGHEVGVRVTGPSVLVVVVALATLDVVGERLRDRAVRAVLRHDIRDVISHHAAEPAALVAHVLHRLGVAGVADVERRRDAERDRVGVAAGGLRRIPNRLDHPLGDVDVGELQDEAVADLAGELERLRSVGGHPHLEFAALAPRELQHRALVLDGPAVGELADDVDRLAQLGHRHRGAVGDAHRRVAATDAADRAVAVELVESREDGCGDGPVARRRVGDERADLDAMRLGEDLAVDDVRLLPQDVGVEGPDVAEPVLLGELREVDCPAGRRVGLKNCSEIHVPPPRPGTATGRA